MLVEGGGLDHWFIEIAVTATQAGAACPYLRVAGRYLTVMGRRRLLPNRLSGQGRSHWRGAAKAILL